MRNPVLRRLVCMTGLVCALQASGCLIDRPVEPSAGADDRIRLRPMPGLSRVDVPIPGVLELLPSHRIGGYDSILVRDSRLVYRYGSLELTRDAEEVFLDLLKASVVTAIEAATVPTANAPGRCVMEVEFDVSEMDLETADYSPELAKMIVAMTFRDSVSGEALLRYARRARIDHPAAGVSDDEQLRTGLQQVVVEMNVDDVLRPAGLATDEGIEGCEGVLAARGRAALEAPR